MKKYLFIALMVVFVTSTVAGTDARAASTVRAGVFNPHTFTLKNGMEVVVLPNSRAPVVLHMVWYKVGSADEPKGKSGIAHLLEHLMFKGTKKYPGGEFSRLLAQHGGQENAFTSFDYTGYHQTVSSSRLEMVMRLEADRMTNLVLDADDVVTERAVVLEERNQRIENKPGARLREQANQTLYPEGHAYGRPVIGWRNELKALNRGDALAFYQAHYVPQNAILVIAGDVKLGQVKRLAEQYYGVIPARPGVGPKSLLAEQESIKGGETVLKDPRVRQASWSQSIIQPSQTNGSDAKVLALEVLSQVLGQGGTSRLYRTLVIEKAMAVNAGTYYDSSRRGEGRFVFYASPRSGVDLDALALAVHAQAKRLLTDGFDAGELARLKSTMLAQGIYVRDEMKSGAWALGGALAAGHSIEDVEAWPERLSAVTEQDVLDALTDVLREPRRITTKLLPGEATP